MWCLHNIECVHSLFMYFIITCDVDQSCWALDDALNNGLKKEFMSYWFLSSFSTIFQLYRWGNHRKPPTCHKSLTKCCTEYTSPCDWTHIIVILNLIWDNFIFHCILLLIIINIRIVYCLLIFKVTGSNCYRITSLWTL
jgi:hypothetical protein